MGDYLKLFPSTASLVAVYSSLSTSLMLFKTAYHQLIPKQVEAFVVSKLTYYFSHKSSFATFIIDDSWRGLGRNELYEAARVYLSTKIGPENRTIRVGKLEQQKNVTASIPEGEIIVDTFEDIKITWCFVHEERSTNNNNHLSLSDKSFYRLTFDDNYREKIQNDYLIHVLNTYKTLMQGEKDLKLYTQSDDYERGKWKPIDFRHPATFDTLALDSKLKKAIMDDLDRFLARKDFYKRVGKAWKRGYLLYGPPGTGKSSLIAAMANYLNFDVYDLELASIHSNSELRKVLLKTTNRSILVVEDIDCSSEVHDRSKITESELQNRKKYIRPFTLSTLLNCIDGLWSSCGEERIIVFTTNRKEVLDPALLRPGRMDMHINMSYCTTQVFRDLAFNYLGIHNHPLFVEIDDLIRSTEVTPASIAEELMKGNDANVALGEVLSFLKQKKEQDTVEEEKQKMMEKDEKESEPH